MNIIMHSPTHVWWNPEQWFLTRLSIGHYHSVQEDLPFLFFFFFEKKDLPFLSSPVRARCRRNSERCLIHIVCLSGKGLILALTARHGPPDVHVRQLFLLRKKTGAASTPGHLTCAAALNHNWELKNQKDRQGIVQDPEAQGAYPGNQTKQHRAMHCKLVRTQDRCMVKKQMQVARQW